MRLRAGAVPCALLFAARPLASAADLYTLTDLGFPPELNGSASGQEINEAGVVVGQVNTPGSRAFIWDSANHMRHIPLLPGRNVNSAEAINDFNQVVGSAFSASFPRHAFSWNASTNALRDLGTLPGGTTSFARAINNAGQVAGSSDTPQGQRAALWDAAGNIQSLGLLPGGTINSFATDINALGHVVGGSRVAAVDSHAFLWDAVNGMQDIGELPGGPVIASAQGINDVGQVVGQSSVEGGGSHAFYWDASSGMVDLGDFPGGNDSSRLFDINDAGVAVGQAHDASGSRGLVWDAAHGIRDVNTLLDSAGAGWTVFRLWGLNDAGVLVGEASHPNGSSRAVLLRPVPEPAGLALLGLLLLLHRPRPR